MADQALNITAVTENFETWKGYKDNLETAETNLAGIGSKPSLPSFVDDVAEDYDAAVTARTTWETNKALYENQIASYTSLKAAEEALLIDKLPPNMWVQVDLDPEGSGDFYWIGYNTNDEANYQEYIRLEEGESQPGTPLTHNMDAE